MLVTNVCCAANTFSLEQIGVVAGKEFSLEKQLGKMKTEWADMTFTIIQYRDEVSCYNSVNSAVGLSKDLYKTINQETYLSPFFSLCDFSVNNYLKHFVISLPSI